MPGVVRKPDNCSGHGCWPPRPSATASSDVLTNGLQTERKGDSMKSHCCPPPCHGGSHTGSRKVLVNGRAMQAKGDPIDCGSVCQQCSSNVFANP